MKYIIKDTIAEASARMAAIKEAARRGEGSPVHSDWLPSYDSLALTIQNQVTDKGAFAYIPDADMQKYYTADEISGAVDLSRDWYLLGFRQVVKDIADCPKTGMRRKVYLRNLNIDCGEVLADLSQPVANQKITGYYNIVTLTKDGALYSGELCHFDLTSPVTLTMHDFYFGEGISAMVMIKFDDLFR